MNFKAFYNYISNNENLSITKISSDGTSKYIVDSAEKKNNNVIYIFGKKLNNTKVRYAFILDDLFNYKSTNTGEMLVYLNDNLVFTFNKN